MALNLRRLVLDLDKAIARPDHLTLSAAIVGVAGVEAMHLAVTDIDLDTVGMTLVVEGESIDYQELVSAIEASGTVVRSLDEIVAGERLIMGADRPRARGR